MTNIGTSLFTLFFGKKVGSDEFGNDYYRSSARLGKFVGRYNKERRWVIFKGKKEASKIPPHWHGWIHYSIDDIPSSEDTGMIYNWQKRHTPNLTGTDNKYLPSGHQKNDGVRDKATGDYKPWQPNQ